MLMDHDFVARDAEFSRNPYTCRKALKIWKNFTRSTETAKFKLVASESKYSIENFQVLEKWTCISHKNHTL